MCVGGGACTHARVSLHVRERLCVYVYVSLCVHFYSGKWSATFRLSCLAVCKAGALESRHWKIAPRHFTIYHTLLHFEIRVVVLCVPGICWVYSFFRISGAKQECFVLFTRVLDPCGNSCWISLLSHKKVKMWYKSNVGFLFIINVSLNCKSTLSFMLSTIHNTYLP